MAKEINKESKNKLYYQPNLSLKIEIMNQWIAPLDVALEGCTSTTHPEISAGLEYYWWCFIVVDIFVIIIIIINAIITRILVYIQTECF